MAMMKEEDYNKKPATADKREDQDQDQVLARETCRSALCEANVRDKYATMCNVLVNRNQSASATVAMMCAKSYVGKHDARHGASFATSALLLERLATKVKSHIYYIYISLQANLRLGDWQKH